MEYIIEVITLLSLEVNKGAFKMSLAQVIRCNFRSLTKTISFAIIENIFVSLHLISACIRVLDSTSQILQVLFSMTCHCERSIVRLNSSKNSPTLGACAC
jgi:ABC-type uncharacterized transport system permease subunit